MCSTGMEMRELDMSDSETEFLLNPERDNRNSNNSNVNVASIALHQSHRNRRKRVRKLGTILRFVCG